MKHKWTNRIDRVWRCERCKKIQWGQYGGRPPNITEECSGRPPESRQDYIVNRSYLWGAAKSAMVH